MNSIYINGRLLAVNCVLSASNMTEVSTAAPASPSRRIMASAIFATSAPGSPGHLGRSRSTSSMGDSTIVSSTPFFSARR